MLKWIALLFYGQLRLLMAQYVLWYLIVIQPGEAATAEGGCCRQADDAASRPRMRRQAGRKVEAGGCDSSPWLSFLPPGLFIPCIGSRSSFDGDFMLWYCQAYGRGWPLACSPCMWHSWWAKVVVAMVV